jgi:5'-phosphate synthase pdxT subunit
LSSRIRIGVLAIQGDVEAHSAMLEQVGVEPVRLLRAAQLDALDGIVIPGGESTTISKGIARLDLWQPLRDFCDSGRSVLGTCAGAILLARASENHPVPTLGCMDFSAARNAYGTQVDSFAAYVDSAGPAGPAEPAGPLGPTGPAGPADLEDLRCVFIRAPRFDEIGPAVEVLAEVDRVPVLIRQGALIACAFHPELTQDPRVHELMLEPARAA